MTEQMEPIESFSHHHRHASRHGPHGLVAGLVVVAFGTLLLLRELAVLPADTSIWSFWPLLLIGFGLSQLGFTRGAFGSLVALFIALLGVALLLANLHLISFGVARLWPVLIVLIGAGMLWQSLTHRRRCTQSSVEPSADTVNRSVTMGASQIRVESQQFKGGSLSAVMGGIELDLRHAAMNGVSATLDIYSVMGGIEIEVPEGWQIISQITPVLGAVEDHTRPSAGPSDERKRLMLTGTVVMGAVTLKS